jgi:hypothetical protein
MKKSVFYILAVVLACSLVGLAPGTDSPAKDSPAMEVFFSPHGGCQDAIVKELSTAKDSVHVQAYSFTNAAIAKALLEANKRRVKVEVVIDQGRITEGYSEATFLFNQGIPVFGDGKHAIAHNKVMVIDGKTVITGSFNFTKAAEESNAENLLIIRSPDLAAKYEKNYQDHLAHSVKYAGKEASSATPAEAAPPATSAAQAIPVSSATSAPQAAPAPDPTVYVTNSGKKYHSAGCRYLAKSAIPMKLSEAKKQYAPCSVCSPPQ